MKEDIGIAGKYFVEKSQENLGKASNKGEKVVSPTDSIDLGRCVAALSFIFGLQHCTFASQFTYSKIS